jgi:hypothetical protein
MTAMPKPKHLVDPGAYTRCPCGYWRRLPFVYTAVTLSAVLALIAALWPLYPAVESYLTRNPQVSLSLIVAGLLFYFLFLRPYMRGNRASSDPDPMADRPAAVPAGASWYLAVVKFTSDGRLLPGMLSVVQDGLAFSPIEGPAAESLTLGPRESLTLATTPAKLRLTDRLFFAHTPDLLHVSSPTASALFLLPCPDTTLPALKAALDEA